MSITSDFNIGGLTELNLSFTKAYSVSANGRATLDWANGIAYLVDQNNGYFMTPTADGATFGAFEPQNGEPFSINSLVGTFLLNTTARGDAMLENDAGWMTLANNGTAAATLYINTGSGASSYSLTGQVTVASNGRGTLTLITTPPSLIQELVFWAISPSRAVAILTVNEDDIAPALLHLQRTE